MHIISSGYYNSFLEYYFYCYVLFQSLKLRENNENFVGATPGKDLQSQSTVSFQQRNSTSRFLYLISRGDTISQNNPFLRT